MYNCNHLMSARRVPASLGLSSRFNTFLVLRETAGPSDSGLTAESARVSCRSSRDCGDCGQPHHITSSPLSANGPADKRLSLSGCVHVVVLVSNNSSCFYFGPRQVSFSHHLQEENEEPLRLPRFSCGSGPVSTRLK